MTRDPDADPMPASHFIVSRRQRIHYLDWGNPAAPTLLLIHGGEDHARSWDRIARALCRDWHVVVPDLRGHGESDWSSDGGYAMPFFVYDLAVLIDLVSARQPVTVVGHSLGGAIALRHAGIHPERIRRLVAMEGLGLSPAKAVEQAAQPVAARWREWIDRQGALAARSPRRYATIGEAAERMQAHNPHLTADQAYHLTVHGLRRDETGTYAWKFDPLVRSWPPVDEREDDRYAFWTAITCPVLLCHGADSWASHPGKDGRASHFRDARVVSFAGAGHWMHHDQPDAFMATLLDFLPRP